MSKKGVGGVENSTRSNPNHTDEEDNKVQGMEVICLWEHPERKDWDFFPAMRISTRGKVCEGKFKPSQ